MQLSVIVSAATVLVDEEHIVQTASDGVVVVTIIPYYGYAVGRVSQRALEGETSSG